MAQDQHFWLHLTFSRSELDTPFKAKHVLTGAADSDGAVFATGAGVCSAASVTAFSSLWLSEKRSCALSVNIEGRYYIIHSDKCREGINEN